MRILEEGKSLVIMEVHNTKMAAFAILQMCSGVSLWFSQDDSLSLDEVVDLYFSFICKGVIACCIDKPWSDLA